MSEVTSVNSKTGAVVLKATDVEAVPDSSIGEPNGVASLNSGGKLPEAELLSSVEIGSPPPTGVAATDTANVKAALKAAGEANGVAVFNKPGTYAINEELVRPHTASVIIGPNTILQATAPFTGTCLLTDSKTEKTEWRAITGGGELDSNNVAKHALFARYFGHMTFGVVCKNSLEDDCTLGDSTATASSYEAYLEPSFWVNRTSGSVPVGHYCVWVQNCSDGRVSAGNVFKGQETGIRVDLGGWKGFGAHPYGAAFKMQVCLELNASGEWCSSMFDTPTPATHGEATGEAATSTITDSNILSQHECRPVTGTNVPAESFVGAVTPGVSFTLVNKNGVAVKPTGAVAGIILLGVGALVRSSGVRILGGSTFNNSTYGVNKGCVGAVIGPSVVKGVVLGFEAAGATTEMQVARALVGKLSVITWSDIIEKNCTEVTSPFEELEEVNASLKPLATQQTPGFSRESNGVVRLRGGYEATAAIAKEAKLFSLPSGAHPSSAGAKIEVKLGTAITYLTVKSNGEVVLSEEVKEKGAFSLDSKTFSTV
jgi:hypothetical protein